MNTQLRAVRGQMMSRGVVKAQRRIRGDVLNSPQLNACVGRLNFFILLLQFRGDGGKMNLYRSFGNLMEAWVSDGGQCLDSTWLGNNDEEDPPTPSSDVGTTLRSESVDSGVETASSVTSLPATPCSVSTDNTEIDTFTAEREGLTPASASQSPVFSSPSSLSPHLLPSRAREGPSALEQVEQALQKTDSLRLKKGQEAPSVDEVLRRRPRASLVPKRHTSELLRGQRSGSFGQRSESFGPRRTVSSSARQMSDMCRRPTSLCFETRPRSEGLGGDGEKTELSPGLCYLEQVCQMLEEVARQQMQSRGLQMEPDAPREHQDMEQSQALDTCQTDSKAAEEDLSSSQGLKITENAELRSSERQPRKEFPYRHFRRRSSSDTNISTMHLRQLRSDCRGQHLSKYDLLEKVEEDHEKQEFEKEETIKSHKSWRLKFGSWTKDSSLKYSNGQQLQSSEKTSARRRLSQLFRRRRETAPV